MRRFEHVYQKYREIIFRFAIRRVGRHDLAEELTADAFLELHLHWDSIDVDRLPSWLFTVVRNRAMDHFRREGLEKQFVQSKRSSIECRESEVDKPLFDNPALKPVHRTCLKLRNIH